MELNRFFDKQFFVNETGNNGRILVGDKAGKENVWVNVNNLINYLSQFYGKSKDESLKKAFKLYIESL